MALEDDGRMWPDIPPGLKYIDIRLPGTFRELVANSSFTHEDIGRIIRCLALDTDFFITQKIEPEVFYYRRKLISKNKTRMRVEAHRRRKRGSEAGRLSEETAKENTSVTVTLDGETTVVQGVDSLSLSQKTPILSKEKTPPIVPLETKILPSLENADIPHSEAVKRERIAGAIQQDLFAAVEAKSTERPQGSPLARPCGKNGQDVVQDIETPQNESLVAPDTRADAAWIPERFAVFWKAYPKHVAKKNALKAFTRVVKTQKDVDKFMKTLLMSIDWWKKQDQWSKDDGKYIPHPASWLNGGQWEDAAENTETTDGSDENLLKSDSLSDDELLRRMEGV